MDDVRALKRKLASVADLLSLVKAHPGVVEEMGCALVDTLEAQVTQRFPTISALEQSILALMVVKMVVGVFEAHMDLVSQEEAPDGDAL
jgi:hypothetical protein